MGAGFGLAAENPWATVLWKACAAALASAILTRWWSRVWLQGLRESIENHRAASSPTNRTISKA